MRVLISEGAEQDLKDGARFYEDQSAGLGEYFLDTLFADVESLRLYAGIHERHYDHYRLLSKRFPYAIYYRVHGETIEIRAILDCRRDPARIEERIGNS